MELIRVFLEFAAFVWGMVVMLIGFSALVILMNWCLTGLRDSRPWGKRR